MKHVSLSCTENKEKWHQHIQGWLTNVSWESLEKDEKRRARERSRMEDVPGWERVLRNLCVGRLRNWEGSSSSRARPDLVTKHRSARYTAFLCTAGCTVIQLHLPGQPPVYSSQIQEKTAEGLQTKSGRSTALKRLFETPDLSYWTSGTHLSAVHNVVMNFTDSIRQYLLSIHYVLPCKGQDSGLTGNMPDKSPIFTRFTF